MGESQPLMEMDARIAPLDDSGNEIMESSFLARLDKRFQKRAADLFLAVVRIHIYGDLGRPVICRPVGPAAQRRPAHYNAIQLGDDDGITGSVLTEPPPLLLGALRDGVERRRGIEDGVVVYPPDGFEVVWGGRPYLQRPLTSRLSSLKYHRYNIRMSNMSIPPCTMMPDRVRSLNRTRLKP
jgi:hypothetical protein